MNDNNYNRMNRQNNFDGISYNKIKIKLKNLSFL